MSSGDKNLGLAQEFFKLGDEITALEDKRDKLRAKMATTLPGGYKMFWSGKWYEWSSYFTTRVSWKDLYWYAFGQLDDQGQVLTDHQKEKATTQGHKKHWKFNKLAS